MLIAKIATLNHPDGEQLVVDASTLWEITSFSKVMLTTCNAVVDAIHKLEEETGRKWYGR